MRWVSLFALAPLAGCYVTNEQLAEQILEQQDLDNDGHLDAKFKEGDDCDDNNADIHPDQEEICDGIDNNCDDEIDGADATGATAWYADTDGDGFGDGGAETVSCDAPAGHVSDNTDCDDTVGEVNPEATEVCDSIDNNCDGEVDEDSASDAPTWYADTDGDGFGDAAVAAIACQEPSGHVTDDTDCDDTSSTVNPGETEVCNGVDDDCEGTSDGPDAQDAATWYRDADGDGFGNAVSSQIACSQPTSHVSDNRDCNDGNGSIYPGAPEYCSTTGVDDDCDGLSDESDAVDQSFWYTDSDSDGYGNPTSVQSACTAPTGTVADNTDCDDSTSAVHPGATELCSTVGVDDDCDGTADEGDAPDVSTWYADFDLDSYGDAAQSSTACSAPSGYVADDSDCDDSDPTVNPDAMEALGNNTDSDCDGDNDELDWISVSNQGAGNVKGVRMTSRDDTIYMGWTADSFSSPTTQFNALALRTIDATNPLVAASTDVYASSYQSRAFQDPFDLVAGGSHLYWGQTNTDASANTTGLAIIGIDPAGGTLSEYDWDSIYLTDSTSFTDLQLFAFESGGVGYLQAVTCSLGGPPIFLFGERVDYWNTPSQVSATSNYSSSSLYNRPICSSYYYPDSSTSAGRSYLMLGYDSSVGQPPYAHYFYRSISDPTLDYYGTYNYYTVDNDTVANRGYVASIQVHDYPSGSTLTAWIANDPITNSATNTTSLNSYILQIDTDISSSGKVATCGVSDMGYAYLYVSEPLVDTTDSDTYSLIPSGVSSNGFNECAVAVGDSGGLTIALRAGDNLYLGAAALP